MKDKTCVYEDIKYNQGWYDEIVRFLDVVRFLDECVGGKIDPDGDGDVWNFFQEVDYVEGVRGGRAKEVLTFKGHSFEVDRKPLPVYHVSQKGRWQVRVKFLG